VVGAAVAELNPLIVAVPIGQLVAKLVGMAVDRHWTSGSKGLGQGLRRAGRYRILWPAGLDRIRRGAFALVTIGTAPLLGSWAGLLSCAGLSGMVAVRAVLEERVLKDELHGYQAYMARVRYRLIPHVW
jgi:hypothetical protein